MRVSMQFFVDNAGGLNYLIKLSVLKRLLKFLYLKVKNFFVHNLLSQNV